MSEEKKRGRPRTTVYRVLKHVSEQDVRNRGTVEASSDKNAVMLMQDGDGDYVVIPERNFKRYRVANEPTVTAA